MQRGWRSTGTNAVNNAPSPPPEAALTGTDGFAAASDSEIHIAPVMPATLRIGRNNPVKANARFIQPPSDGWVTGGFVSRSRRKQHLQWPAPRTGRPALQFHRPFRYFPRCGFLFLDIHLCATQERY